jgi:hypothetical protein
MWIINIHAITGAHPLLLRNQKFKERHPPERNRMTFPWTVQRNYQHPRKGKEVGPQNRGSGLAIREERTIK